MESLDKFDLSNFNNFNEDHAGKFEDYRTLSNNGTNNTHTSAQFDINNPSRNDENNLIHFRLPPSTEFDQIDYQIEFSKEFPEKRWGHSAVTAYNWLFIIGGYDGKYLGNIWVFDFNDLKYTQAKIYKNIKILNPGDNVSDWIF